MIDPNKNFQSIYSFYQHDIFGVLLSAYVIELTADGRPGLRYQRLLPDNFAQFRYKLDPIDEELTALLYEISLQQLYKNLGSKEPSIDKFLKKMAQPALKQAAIDYIQQRLIAALPLMGDRWVFRMGKDGYPATKQLMVSIEPADVTFYVQKLDQQTQYRAVVQHENKEMDLLGGQLLSLEPAWVQLGESVIGFLQTVDGKKLLPFFTKSEIIIPKQHEPDFYEKFLSKIIEGYPVITEGIEILSESGTPVFLLKINKSKSDYYIFQFAVKYGNNEISLNDVGLASVRFEYVDQKPKYFRIARAVEIEENVRKEILKMNAELGGGFEMTLRRETALSWLGNNIEKLLALNFEIITDVPDNKWLFKLPVYDFSVLEVSDGVQVSATINIDEVTFPLAAIRSAVIKGNFWAELPNGKIVLLSENQVFELRSFFEVSQTLPDGSYFFELAHLNILSLILKALTNKSYEFKLLNSFMNALSDSTIELSEAFNVKLREYQKNGYQWLCNLYQYQLGGILADEIGLGKTVMTLAFCQYIIDNQHLTNSSILIVTTCALVNNWMAEAQKWTPKLSITLYQGSDKQTMSKNFYSYNLILITYAMLKQEIKIIDKLSFQAIILDRIEEIKNFNTKTIQCIQKLSAKSKIAITDQLIQTPISSICWLYFNITVPNLLGSQSFFEKYYVEPIQNRKDVGRAMRWNSITSPFLLRRTQKEVFQELPGQIQFTIYCNMTAVQKQLYTQTQELYRNTLLSDTANFGEKETTATNLAEKLNRLRQIAVHPQLVLPTETDLGGKIPAIIEKIHELMQLQSAAKILICSQYIKLLKFLQSDLTSQSLNVLYIDNQSEEIETITQRFKTDSKCKILLLYTKGLSTKLNLKVADYIFIPDPWWHIGIESEEMIRTYMIGSGEKPVLVFRFVTMNTVEEKMIILKEKKMQVSKEMPKTENSFLKSLNHDEIAFLLS